VCAPRSAKKSSGVHSRQKHHIADGPIGRTRLFLLRKATNYKSIMHVSFALRFQCHAKHFACGLYRIFCQVEVNHLPDFRALQRVQVWMPHATAIQFGQLQNLGKKLLISATPSYGITQRTLSVALRWQLWSHTNDPRGTASHVSNRL